MASTLGASTVELIADLGTLTISPLFTSAGQTTAVTSKPLAVHVTAAGAISRLSESKSGSISTSANFG